MVASRTVRFCGVLPPAKRLEFPATYPSAAIDYGDWDGSGSHGGGRYLAFAASDTSLPVSNTRTALLLRAVT
ncbi:MAG: hypothetical protein WDO73_37895 [Ignavibacteriota bacterium]